MPKKNLHFWLFATLIRQMRRNGSGLRCRIMRELVSRDRSRKEQKQHNRNLQLCTKLVKKYAVHIPISRLGCGKISDKNANKCPNVLRLSPDFTHRQPLNLKSIHTAVRYLRQHLKRSPNRNILTSSSVTHLIPSPSPIRVTSLSTKNIIFFAEPVTVLVTPLTIKAIIRTPEVGTLVGEPFL